MGMGLSLILLALGAMLRFGFEHNVWDVNGTDVHANNIGVILMIIGAIGILASLLWAALFNAEHRSEKYTHDVIVDRVPDEEPRRVVRRRKVRKIDRDPNYPDDSAI